MYTSHGHHISGTILDESKPRPPIARCGGPGLCKSCSQEAMMAINQKEKTDMIETTRYVRKPFEVEAVEVTAENMAEVAAWCHGEILSETNGNFIKVRVARVLNERQTKAYVGDWVLYAGTGFKVYTAKAFKKTFALKQETMGVERDAEVQAEKVQPQAAQQ